MDGSLKRNTLNGTLWSAVERFSAQGIGFIVMIIMARILTPEDYGLVGMITVFISVSQSLVDSGFSQALIRKQDRSEIDNSTVFYFNIVIGFILYFILYISAPIIAKFYDEPTLISLTRLISLSIIINSFVVVQRALLTVEIDFKTQAKASIIASVISGIIGITMAYTGWGVWAIVIYQLSNMLVNVSLLWIFSKWHPTLVFSWASFIALFSFGSKLAISGIINTIYNNVYLIVIGKFFKASDLGYYTRANQFSEFPSANLTGILQRVTFPVLCSIQNNDDKLRNAYRIFLRLSGFVIFPLMIGLAAVAHPFIILILKEKWEFTAVLLQILCFAMMWYPIHAINLNLLQVMGRSDLFLKLEIWKKCIGILIICLTLPFGLIALSFGQIVSSIISLIINTYYTGKLIDLGFRQQLKDLSPALLYSFSMGIIVYLIIHIFNNYTLQLCCGICGGFIYYFLITRLTHSHDLRVIIELIKERNIH